MSLFCACDRFFARRTVTYLLLSRITDLSLGTDFGNVSALLFVGDGYGNVTDTYGSVTDSVTDSVTSVAKKFL